MFARAADEQVRGPNRFKVAEVSRAVLTSGPAVLWLTVFFFLPLTLILGVSFLTRDEWGQAGAPLTFENYWRLAGFGLLGFDPLYPQIIGRSFVLGLATALACLVTGLPLAFFIAGLSARARNLALTLVVIPLWTNLLVRTYAWQILLAPDGLLTQVACGLGLVSAGAGLYPGTFAVFLCMICDYLPFLVLPLYASVEKIDWTLAEAAADLGASRVRVFRHALWPQLKPGLAAGVLLVFLPATGQFVIPDLLGGAKTVLLGNAVQQQFGSSADWPFGSAIAVLGLATLSVAVYTYARLAGRRGPLELA
jgi:spermidine/putrescine transport system permease protein